MGFSDFRASFGTTGFCMSIADRMNSDANRAGGQVERDIEQAITALKKGAYLLKYGRRGKPKFCPFRLSNVLLVVNH